MLFRFYILYLCLYKVDKRRKKMTIINHKTKQNKQLDENLVQKTTQDQSE